MKKFNAAVFLEPLRVYAFEMSERAIEPYAQQKIKDLLSREHTDAEVYDLCAWLSELACDRIGKTPNGASISVGDIDAFGQALFDVKKWYERPL